MAANIYLRKVQTHAVSKLLTENKNSCRPLAVLQDLDPTVNRKPYLWPWKNIILNWEKQSQLRNDKILCKIYRNYPCLFFPLESLVNVFISSLVFLLSKKCEKLKQILIMPPIMIKICFNGKGFLWDHAKLNRLIYIKNILLKLEINLQCDRSTPNFYTFVSLLLKLPYFLLMDLASFYSLAFTF